MAVGWNKGRTVGQKKPLTSKELQLIHSLLSSQKKTRELALFTLAVDSLLRRSDIVGLRVQDITSPSRVVFENFTITQQKTGRPVTCVLQPETQAYVQAWIIEKNLAHQDWLFPSSWASRNTHLHPERYVQLLKNWVQMIGLDPALYASHSLRRTKASIIFESTLNLEAVRILLGHKTLVETSAYLNCDARKVTELAKSHCLWSS